MTWPTQLSQATHILQGSTLYNFLFDQSLTLFLNSCYIQTVGICWVFKNLLCIIFMFQEIQAHGFHNKFSLLVITSRAMVWETLGNYPLAKNFSLYFHKCIVLLVLRFFLYKKFFCPGWCSSGDWARVSEPKGRQFDSQSGHMPGLWARSPAWGTQEATTRCFSPSLSPFLPLSLKINKF